MPILPSLGNVRVSLSVMIDDCSAAQDGTLKWLTQKAGARSWSSPQHLQPKEGRTEAAVFSAVISREMRIVRYKAL